VAQFTDRTKSGRYSTKVQPLIAEQVKIPRRNNFAGPSSGNGRWKAVVLSALSAPFLDQARAEEARAYPGFF
jgi:hypothetical protein